MKGSEKSDEEITASSHNNESEQFRERQDIQLVSCLRQILESLMVEKEEFYQRMEGKQRFLNKELTKKDEIIYGLVQQNNRLKGELQLIRSEHNQGQLSLKKMRQSYQTLKSEYEGLKSVVGYLQCKNKELSFQIYSLLKTDLLAVNSKLDKYGNSDTLKVKKSKWTANNLEQQSIFEYMEQYASNDLRRVESVPIIQTNSEHKSKVEASSIQKTTSRKRSLQKSQKGNKRGSCQTVSPSLELIDSKDQKIGLSIKRGSLSRNALICMKKKKGEKISRTEHNQPFNKDKKTIKK